jgi:hypothetical protein
MLCKARVRVTHVFDHRELPVQSNSPNFLKSKAVKSVTWQGARMSRVLATENFANIGIDIFPKCAVLEVGPEIFLLAAVCRLVAPARQF